MILKLKTWELTTVKLTEEQNALVEKFAGLVKV